MLQYKIPQNVGIEDKIVGPLSLRQLIILSIGIGISYVLFAIINKLYELNALEYVIISLPAIVAAAMALVKIHNVTFTKFVMLFLEFSLKPKQRVWDHRGIAAIVMPDLTDHMTKKSKEVAEKEITKGAVNLEDLGRVLDSGGFDHVESVEHADIDKAKDDTLVQQAFFGHKKNKTENMYWRTADSHKERLKVMAKQNTSNTPVQASVNADQQGVVAVAPQKVKAKTSAQSKNKSRKRRQDPKPARSAGHVNTMQKNQPVTYEKTSNEPDKQSGEFKFEELKKGEIEINLD